jgi:iron complex outermembrane receptor protein
LESWRIGRVVAAWVGACASIALAQGPAPELERVVVTGSALPQTDEYSAAPVQVLTREDIARTGALTLQQLFERTSNIGGGFRDTGGLGTFAEGSSTVALRGLGLQQTLVLFNGRRVAPYPLAQYADIFTNIDALPFEAIERVEILRSGGSAIYGSEAIAGVVNVITRGDYQGLAIKASHERSQKTNRFRSNNASLAGGHGDLAADGYNLLFSIDLFRRQNVIWRNVLTHVNPQSTANFPSFGTRSTFSYPGNVLPGGAIAGCAPELVTGGLCFYDRYLRFEAIPEAERLNTMLAGQWRISGTTTGFGELITSNTRTEYISPYAPYGPALGTTIWGDPSTGSERSFTYRGLPSGHPLNPTAGEAELRYRFIDGDASTTARARQYRLLGGIKGGSEASLLWEAAAGVMGGSAETQYRGAFSDSGFRRQIGNPDRGQTDALFFQRGYRIGQPNSPETLADLFPTYGYRGSTTQTFIDGRLSTTVGRIEDRPVRLAAGADLRREHFGVRPTANLLAGDIVGNGLVASDASRTVGAAFGELSLPVTSALQVQAALRIDQYPKLAPRLSPKLGLRFEASPSLLLRGTVERGFRAPNLSESATSTKYSFDPDIPDPKRCTQAQRLAADLRATAAALPAADPQRAVLLARADIVNDSECSASASSIVANNPDLRPESSTNATLGLVWRVTDRVTGTIDLWTLRRKDQIQTKGRGDVLAGEDTIPGSVSRAGLANDRSFSAQEQATYGVTAGAITTITGRFENVAKSKTSGIDFGLRGSVPTPLGTVDLAWNGTYLLEVRNFRPALNDYGDNLARSKLATDVSATLSSGPFKHALTYNYVGPAALQGDYDDTGYTPQGCVAKGWTVEQCRVGSTITWDYHLGYAVTRQLDFSVGVRNLLNRRPGVSLRGMLDGGGGIIPQSTTDVMGRMIRVGVRFEF